MEHIASNESNKKIFHFRCRKFWGLPLFIWLLLASASFSWNIYSLRQNTLEAFRYEAQTIAEVALSTMLWAEQHEQVFLPLTEWIPKEPFYAELPARDLYSICGLRLTQVSPSAIIHQQAELAWLHGLTRKSIRVISLQPLNPVNIPNEWESDTLKLFETGQTERFALIGDGSDAMLKYMVPIRAKSTSLRLPESYKVGDLLGGLSVSERAASRFAMIQPQIISMIATHTVIFMTVAVVMLFLLSHLRCQWLSLDQLNNEQSMMIAKLAENEAKLEEMSVTDELTGLRNRRGFFLFAEQQIKAAYRQRAKICLIFIDVDGMKSVNDKYGHSEGDKSLTEIANILKKTFRESDTIARIGGDEFVILLTRIEEIHSSDIIDRLQKNLELNNASVKTRSELSLSTGLVECDPCEEPCSIEVLLKIADELMYENKRGKTNCRSNCNMRRSAIKPV